MGNEQLAQFIETLFKSSIFSKRTFYQDRNFEILIYFDLEILISHHLIT